MMRPRATTLLLAALVACLLAPVASAQPSNVRGAMITDARRAMIGEILSRPLFEPTRRPLQHVQNAAPAPEPGDPAKPALAARLAGIISGKPGGPGASALLETTAGFVVARVGDDLMGGWRLDEVLSHEARLSNGTERVALVLADREGGPRNTDGAVRRAASQAGAPPPSSADRAEIVPGASPPGGAGADAATQADQESFSPQSLNASLAGSGLGNFPETAASLRGRRVVDGRSVSAAGLAPTWRAGPIDRFDGAGASSAVPSPEGAREFGALEGGADVGEDDFFGRDGGTEVALDEVLNFPAANAVFRGRVAPKIVSLMSPDR